MPVTNPELRAISASNTLYSSGTVVLSGGANVTVGTNGQTITIAAAAGGGLGAVQNSQTTYTSGTVNLVDLANITIRSSTGQRFEFSVAPQSVQTVGGYAVGNTTGQSSSTTLDARTVSLAGQGIVSVGYSAGSINVSATVPAQSNQTGGIYVTAQSTGQSSSSTYDLRTLSIVPDGIISAGWSNGSFRVSATALTSQSNQAASGSNGSFTFQTLTFGNLNGASFYTSNGSIVLSYTDAGGAGGNFSAGASNLGNTAGATGITGTRLVLVGSNNLTLSQTTDGNGATISIIPAAPITYTYWSPYDNYVQLTQNPGAQNLNMHPVQAPNVAYDRLALPMWFTGASNSTGTLSMSVWFGLYTKTASTMSLLSSISSSTAIINSGTVNSSLHNGMRLFTIGTTGTITAGDYYAGYLWRTSSGGANATWGVVAVSQLNTAFAGIMGQAISSSQQYTLGLGVYSATTTGLPASVAFSQITGANSSAILRRNLFYFVSDSV